MDVGLEVRDRHHSLTKGAASRRVVKEARGTVKPVQEGKRESRSDLALAAYKSNK
jgi:hypothetical protein